MPDTLSCGGDPAAFWEELQQRARTGNPLTLLDVQVLGPQEASRVLEFFLHEPGVTSPIEPFATLLGAMIQKRELALWEVASSRTSAARSREAFLRELPQTNPQCLACACFPMCQGYGAWAGSCDTWRVILLGLASAARELTRLRRQHLRPSEPRNSDDPPRSS